MKAKKPLTRRIAAVAMLTALSLITFLIENLFPPILIPGAKLGLANAFSFAALIMFGPIDAFVVVIVRTLLGAIFAGNISAVMYSFTGGMVAMTVSSLLLYFAFPRISVVAVSVASAAAHNLTQNAVYALISATPYAFTLLPYLLLIGALSGTVVGVVITLIFKRVPMNVFKRAVQELKGESA